jgi:type II secretory pathway pseudopilin PulG
VVTCCRPRSRGFFTTDALVGLLIIAALAAALAVGLGRQRRATTRLADSREATRLAERALVALQSDRAPPTAGAEETIVVAKLSGASSTGQQWVEVTATVRARSASLIGLVPRETK